MAKRHGWGDLEVMDHLVVRTNPNSPSPQRCRRAATLPTTVMTVLQRCGKKEPRAADHDDRAHRYAHPCATRR